ncbi:MAG: S46 family peptidase [Bacteroidetes bacterium]|nr:S46 family peptidase [Bacteroidota bacterium]
MRFSNFNKFSAVLIAAVLTLAGCSSYQVTKSPLHTYFNADTVKAGRFDNGKMWTFDNPPTKYFETEYNFSPDSAWFAKTRLSALRLPGCTASFISEDGLVLTNHHCARYALDKVNKSGEDLPDSGFYAPTLADERKVEGMYADQLVLIKDVTPEVQKAFETGATAQERVANGNAEIQKIQKEYWKKYKTEAPADSMLFQVVSFYNGAKYSLYGYHRYTDVRLVFAPQMIVAYFGGDYDNFTYPRYDLDFALFRVYGSDGKPVHSPDYFKWSKEGANEGQPVFVIGNPGRTSRLLSVAQLKFMRDYLYPYYLEYLGNLANIYTKYIADHPDKKLEYQTRLFGISNSQKAITGYLGGLRDAYLMARKEAFERDFMKKVEDSPALEQKYGSVWKDLSKVESEKGKVFPQMIVYDAFGRGSSGYLSIAAKLIGYAEEMKLPEESRPENMRGAKLDTFKLKFFPKSFSKEIETGILASQLSMMQSAFGTSNEAFNMLLEGRTPDNAASYLAGKSALGDSAEVVAMLNGSPEAILSSSDPFIRYVLDTQKKAMELQAQYGKLTAEETSNNILLGRALYDVYGSEIPPDATFTLRIADGVVKGYPYNGTIAPPHTTFYGLYNRFYSFGKQYPWSLPSVWQNPPSDFNLSTPLDFVATNDIIGGNSGSAVINENRHIVGLIFDGNIESLPGDFIYVPAVNRAVAVSSMAIPQALKYIYHAGRLVNEIESGKIGQ